MNDVRTIFFIGKPGSGKSTQAKLLAAKTGWTVIAAGEQFRAMAQEDSPVGHKIKIENDAGILQPYWLATYLYLKSLLALPGSASAIFDGFTRKMPEAELIRDSLAWFGRPYVVVNLVVSNETALARLHARGQTSGRADDAEPEARFKEFAAYTEPAMEIFRAEGTLVEIDGEKPEEEIAGAIHAALNL